MAKRKYNTRHKRKRKCIGLDLEDDNNDHDHQQNDGHAHADNSNINMNMNSSQPQTHYTIPTKAPPIGFIVYNNRSIPLNTTTGTVPDTDLRYTIHPDLRQIQLQTAMEVDEKASSKEKADTLVHRAQLRQELTIALANNQIELDRLADPENNTYNSEDIGLLYIERKRLQKELANAQEGKGTYDLIVKGHNATANAVLCPVWVMDAADVEVDGAAMVDRKPARLHEEKYARQWGKKGTDDGDLDYPAGVFVTNPNVHDGGGNGNGDGNGKTGEVFVCDLKNHRIQVFDEQGTFLRKWGKKGTGDGEFKRPLAVCVSADADGKAEVFVTDLCNERIQVFDSEGGFLRKWGSAGSGDGQFNNIQRLCVSDEGEVYVVDAWNHRIQVFDREGTFLRKWDSKGSGDGEFDLPRGIAVQRDGDGKVEVYVCGRKNHRVQVFDKQGTFLRKWGKEGEKEGEFKCRVNIGVSSEEAGGEVFVLDFVRGCVEVFDKRGAYIRTVGKKGFGEGELFFPLGLCVSAGGEVYVADQHNHRMQVFR